MPATTETQRKIGVLVVSHYRLGEEMLQALRLILPEVEGFHAVGVQPEQSAQEIRAAIAAGLDRVERGAGVLVLTDMFGGTPSNLSLSFLDERNIEVVTGLNLPMLVKLAEQKDALPLAELAATIRAYGQRNISVASELLAKEKT